MTTYRFKRVQNKSFSNFGLLSYIPFLLLIFISFIINIINIPVFFGGEYHIFLFECVAFYLLFIKNYKKAFITFFLFYGILDLIEGIFVGISFIAFFASLVCIQGIMLFSKISVKSLFAQSVILFCFISIFIISKIILLYVFNEFNISTNIILFLIKSNFYSCFLFFNFHLVLNSNKLNRI